MSEDHVAETYLYPVKACAAMRVPSLNIDRWGGAEGDRRWAIVNGDGEVTWQGAHPRLVLVSPTLIEGGLRLAAPSHAPLAVHEDGLAPCSFLIWNEQTSRHDRFDGHDAGDVAAAWVSAVAGATLRLVRMGDDAMGRGSANRLHVVGRASCDETRHDVLRLRPNIVLDGPGVPAFAEDFLVAMRWRSGTLAVGSRCVRCVVPNVDPASGEVDDAVLASLASSSAQRFPGGPVYFGCYGHATPGTRLARGEVVELEFDF